MSDEQNDDTPSTPKRSAAQESKARLLTQLERASVVFDLLKKGASYEQIAKRLVEKELVTPKYNANRVAADVNRAYGLFAAKFATDVEHHRNLELARLDMILAKIMPGVAQKDMFAVDRAHTNIEIRCRILGLDKPQKIQVSGAGTLDVKVEYVNDWRGEADENAPPSTTAAPTAELPSDDE